MQSATQQQVDQAMVKRLQEDVKTAAFNAKMVSVAAKISAKRRIYLEDRADAKALGMSLIEYRKNMGIHLI